MLATFNVSFRTKLQSLSIALASFIALGTASAIWANPLFTRMTPVGDWELLALLIISALTGVFAAIRRPICPMNRTFLGNVAGFLGIACPTCNKVLMFIFGGQALMSWFDPIRPAVSLFGIVIIAYAIRRELAPQEVLPVLPTLSTSKVGN